MKSPNYGQGNRSLLNHGGKGDADRTTNTKAFRDGYDEIYFGSVVAGDFGDTDGFVRTANRQRKVYGPRVN